MVEAKAKDLAVLSVRRALDRLAGKAAYHHAEEGVPEGRLHERTWVGEEGRNSGLAARRMVAVDEVGERVEPDVLGERHSDRNALFAARDTALDLVEREPEERAVRRVDREADRPGEPPPRECLAEQEHVGVVAAEEAPVDRLQETPHRGGDGSGGRWMKASLVHNPKHARG